MLLFNYPTSLQNCHVDNRVGNGDYNNVNDCNQYKNFQNYAFCPRGVVKDNAALASPTMEMTPYLVEGIKTEEDLDVLLIED